MGRGHIGDFLSFWIDDTHSSDLGLTRVSDGSRYTKTLLPSFKDETAEVPGGDGTYYYGSRYEKKEIPIKVAFDDLSESQFRQITQLIGDKQMHRLVFDEEPYKEYVVKIAAPPEFKYLCFDEIENYEDENGEIERRFHRVYKGEGELKFVCYDGYARNRTGYKWLEDYDLEVFNNKNEWLEASKISPKSFGWKILIGGEHPDHTHGVENPIDITQQITTLATGFQFEQNKIYRFCLRDADLRGNIDNSYYEEEPSKPIYYDITTQPKLFYIPQIGYRFGIPVMSEIEKGTSFLLFAIYNESGMIKFWLNNWEGLPWRDAVITVYKLTSAVDRLWDFDEPNLSILDTTLSSVTFYAYNYGDIEVPFKIKFLTTTTAPIQVFLNHELILTIKQFDYNDLDGFKDVSYQINTKTNLIEGLSEDGGLSGTILNKHIISGGFRNLKLGENIIEIKVLDNSKAVSILENCHIEYTNLYL